MNFETKMKDVIWVAKTLFDRGLVSGSTGNVSFEHDDRIYISKGGSSMGRMDENSFAVLDYDSTIIEGKPSKEHPLHTMLYRVNRDNRVVLHTHSFYSTVISCLKDTESFRSDLFKYTPYLKMLTNGNIEFVQYEKPGSQDLFEAFAKTVKEDTHVYVLKNHGLVVAAKDIMSSFNIIEEFEETAKLLVTLKMFDSSEVSTIQ